MVVARHPIKLASQLLPYEKLRNKGYVGAKVIGSSNVEKFLHAFYALSPWDQMKDPSYFDRFLLTSEHKPLRLLFEKK